MECEESVESHSAFVEFPVHASAEAPSLSAMIIDACSEEVGGSLS